MKKFIYPSIIALAAITWGISGLFVRELSALNFSTYEIVFLRLLTATTLISIGFLIFNKKVYNIKLKDLWCFIGTGVVGVLGCSVCYFATMERASLSVACILMYTAPIFVTVFSAILFKEKITKVKIIGLILTFLGCVLCSYKKGGFALSIPTFFIGIGSGICYGSYSIFSRFAINKGYDSKTILVYSFIFALLGSSLLVPYKNLISNIQGGFNFVLPTVGLGIIATTVPYWLYTMGLKKVENSKASIIACLEIVASLLVGLIFYLEIPSIYNIIGIILVFISVVIL